LDRLAADAYTDWFIKNDRCAVLAQVFWAFRWQCYSHKKNLI
jgi:hypothetical protein